MPSIFSYLPAPLRKYKGFTVAALGLATLWAASQLFPSKSVQNTPRLQEEANATSPPSQGPEPPQDSESPHAHVAGRQAQDNLRPSPPQDSGTRIRVSLREEHLRNEAAAFEFRQSIIEEWKKSRHNATTPVQFYQEAMKRISPDAWYERMSKKHRICKSFESNFEDVEKNGCLIVVSATGKEHCIKCVPPHTIAKEFFVEVSKHLSNTAGNAEGKIVFANLNLKFDPQCGIRSFRWFTSINPNSLCHTFCRNFNEAKTNNCMVTKNEQNPSGNCDRCQDAQERECRSKHQERQRRAQVLQDRREADECARERERKQADERARERERREAQIRALEDDRKRNQARLEEQQHNQARLEEQQRKQARLEEQQRKQAERERQQREHKQAERERQQREHKQAQERERQQRVLEQQRRAAEEARERYAHPKESDYSPGSYTIVIPTNVVVTKTTEATYAVAVKGENRKMVRIPHDEKVEIMDITEVTKQCGGGKRACDSICIRGRLVGDDWKNITVPKIVPELNEGWDDDGNGQGWITLYSTKKGHCAWNLSNGPYPEPPEEIPEESPQDNPDKLDSANDETKEPFEVGQKVKEMMSDQRGKVEAVHWKKEKNEWYLQIKWENQSCGPDVWQPASGIISV